MDRFICIHGHFYQPPRENPWLEAIELQDSAYPYHDWNERITSECYAPNTASRIVDADNWITAIVNNYEKISFNFGPTLLAWMAECAPKVYEAILGADAASRLRFAGHGSAMAQAYNHMILPLANSRDKYTQIFWGLRDFQHRFGREPEGMWLPETAVDMESLDIMARLGLKFTVLSPYQASRVKPVSGRHWRDVSGGRIDPSTAYRIRLSGGRRLALLFYDGPISTAVAFEDLLGRGDRFAERLATGFSDTRTWPQLMHIATDGETYGHHRRFADQTLAYALDHIESKGIARLTNYGEHLAAHPPAFDVQIIENTAWSCSHGVGRWSTNCGCNTGRGGWNQEWRAPLRAALDWLRDRLALRFEENASRYFPDPWAARNGYIDVILNRDPENVERFFSAHGARLSGDDRIRALKMLEMQRHAMLMYTSCGWFFDEISGIETVQVIQYAARALQLGHELFGDGLEAEFLSRLEQAKSNIPEHGDGRRIFEKFVRPAMVDLEKVAAHFAISSLFENYPERSRIYSHSAAVEDIRVLQEGRTRLALGRVEITSEITCESASFNFGVLHLGDHNLTGGVRAALDQERSSRPGEDLVELFDRGDVPELLRAVDRAFGSGAYSLRLLFRDQQRRVVEQILGSAMADAAALYRHFYDQHGALFRFVSDLGIPLPSRCLSAIGFAAHDELEAVLSSEDPSAEQVERILDRVRRNGVELDSVTLEFRLRRNIERAADDLSEHPLDPERLEKLERAVAVCANLPFPVNLWQAQNTFFDVTRRHAAAIEENAGYGREEGQRWLAAARAVGRQLRVRESWTVAEAAR